MSDRREFYVGYLPHAPHPVGRFIRRRVIAIIAVVVAVGAALAFTQNPFPAKVFEWGASREFVGVLQTQPYPELLVRRPGDTQGHDWSRYSLVAQGKTGADAMVEGRHGQWVSVKGALIYRAGQTMIEVVQDGVRPIDSVEAVSAVIDTRGFENLGRHTLVGEIVDSKCWLGVMAPGSTKSHRACATRCISGGIPPVLLVRGGDGRAVYLQLASQSDEAVNDAVLPYVAEVVEISGEVLRNGQRLILRFDPAQIRRTS